MHIRGNTAADRDQRISRLHGQVPALAGGNLEHFVQRSTSLALENSRLGMETENAIEMLVVDDNTAPADARRRIRVSTASTDGSPDLFEVPVAIRLHHLLRRLVTTVERRQDAILSWQDG